MTTVDKVNQFLQGLQELSEKTGVYIEGMGGMYDPSFTIEGEEFYLSVDYDESENGVYKARKDAYSNEYIK